MENGVVVMSHLCLWKKGSITNHILVNLCDCPMFWHLQRLLSLLSNPCVQNSIIFQLVYETPLIHRRVCNTNLNVKSHYHTPPHGPQITTKNKNILHRSFIYFSESTSVISGLKIMREVFFVSNTRRSRYWMHLCTYWTLRADVRSVQFEWVSENRRVTQVTRLRGEGVVN